MFIILFQTNVKIVSLILDEEETEDAHPGENVKIKVTGVEEEVSDWYWFLFWYIVFFCLCFLCGLLENPLPVNVKNMNDVTFFFRHYKYSNFQALFDGHVCLAN